MKMTFRWFGEHDDCIPLWQIRQIPGREAMPIIAMTANAFSEDRARCLDAGMNDFLSKPVVPDKFYATLYAWLQPPAMDLEKSSLT